jgi:hypothetical protein
VYHQIIGLLDQLPFFHINSLCGAIAPTTELEKLNKTNRAAIP